MQDDIRIDTAGWTLPADVRDRFDQGPSNLARYATRFSAVEINSTFYRPHRPTTFQRWAEETPPGFRFTLKAPKTITHDQRLVEPAARLATFLDESSKLGNKRGPILFQLPPSLAFDAGVARRFCAAVRDLYRGPAVLEPRHPTWFDREAETMLSDFSIARVAADPPRAQSDGVPGGWKGLTYYRFHGSPRLYYSTYDEAQLSSLRAALVVAPGEAWCIFDNTVTGAATRNALDLTGLIGV